MMRYLVPVSILVGSMLLTLPTDVAARRYGSEASLRCDPMISESVRGVPHRSAPTPSTRYRYQGKTDTHSSTGLSVHQCEYSDGLGTTSTGKMEGFPGGTVVHRGSWR